MDAFYASIEVHDNPEFKGKPVIVGGSGNRGVVSAASYEARTYGVHSALPILTARKLCPGGVFLPVRMHRYKEVSDIIQDLFTRFTPLVEPISLDEAFLDVTASKHFGSGHEIAEAIRKLIKQETGLTASAGVASSKLIAKIASDIKKPDGLTMVPAGNEQTFLAGLPIEKLWGVGKTTRSKLILLGVHTIGDLSRLPEELLINKFGKMGGMMLQSSLGIDTRPVDTERLIKSIGHEETFETDLINQEIIYRQLLELSIRVGKRLRGNHLLGKTISLKVKYNDFQQVSRAATLKIATDDNMTIYREICSLLAKTRACEKPVRLLGVSLSNLESNQEAYQMNLFGTDERTGKRKRLHQAIDNIEEKFGTSTIIPGALMKKEKQ